VPRDDVTTATYDRIAGDFAEHVWSMHLDPALDAFSQHLLPGARVLDLGCGPGRDTALLRERGFCVIGMDLSMGMLRQALRRVGPGFTCADMRHIPVHDACFDGVWLNAALLHLPREDVPRTLRDVRRTVPAGGALFVAVKQGLGEGWNDWEGQPRFFTYFQPDELACLLADAGFDVIDVHTEEIGGTTWIHALATAAASCYPT
jgi:SAM-dependent methyltransferase